MEQIPIEPDPFQSARPATIGLLGCGTVGSQVARMALDSLGDRAALARIAVRDLDKARPVALDRQVLTADALHIVKDPQVDIVVELIGGIQPAFDLIRQALVEGKHVVTANKAVIARHRPKLEALARDRGVTLLYEGAVCASIPILRVLRGAGPGDRVRSVCGVLNGTTNFILSEIERGLSFNEALAEARAQGFAEADVSQDIDGLDSAAKLAILASHSFGSDVSFDEVERRGIRHISEERVRACVRNGRRLKLVGTALARNDGSTSALVAPVALPRDHPLARIDGAQNGVVIETERSGTLSFYGEGAGGRATAAAVMADLEHILRARIELRSVAQPNDYERRAV